MAGKSHLPHLGRRQQDTIRDIQITFICVIYLLHILYLLRLYSLFLVETLSAQTDREEVECEEMQATPAHFPSVADCDAGQPGAPQGARGMQKVGGHHLHQMDPKQSSVTPRNSLGFLAVLPWSPR